MKRNDHLLFLDTDIYRGPDGSLGHKVYHKPAHNILCLNSPTTTTTTHPVSMLLFAHWYIGLRALHEHKILQMKLLFRQDIFSQNISFRLEWNQVL
jgi:hypothetical protein